MEKLDTLLSIGADLQDAIQKVASTPEEGTEILLQYATRQLRQQCDAEIARLRASMQKQSLQNLDEEKRKLEERYRDLQEQYGSRKRNRIAMEYNITPTLQNGLQKLLFHEVKEASKRYGLTMKPKKKLVVELAHKKEETDKELYKYVRSLKEIAEKESIKDIRTASNRFSQIEEREKVEQELKRAEARQRALFDERLRLYLEETSQWLKSNWVT